jgi:mannose-1-phosphate guanylyltransferase
MFVLKASVWLRRLSSFAQTSPKPPTSLATAQHRRGLLCARARQIQSHPAESVDYAVMERCPGSDFPIQMVPLDAGWSDLGAWDAVWNVLPKDAAGNAHVGDVLHHRQPQHPGACQQPLGQPGGCETWSWSKPQTPCWWPTNRAARTSSTS